MYTSSSPTSFSIKLDLRLVCLALIIVIAGMLALWQPWNTRPAEARKVSISGESSITATPDQFVFSPYYQKTGTDLKAMKAELDAVGKTILSELKKRGVAEDDITLGSNNYDMYYPVAPVEGGSGNQQSVTLNVQITVKTKELAQKVQDYLATTEAKGQLTGQPSFSKEKTKQLETEARQKAIQDARAKADQTARELGAAVGKVISVNDQSDQFNFPVYARGLEDDTKSSSLPVTPGKQDVTYRVTVVFELI